MDRQYQEQFAFLLSSCRAYDQGDLSEAKRIASALRILLHDTSMSISLLGQLGLKGILFYDTSPFIPPGNLLPTFALVGIPMPQMGPYRFMAPGFRTELVSDTWLLPFDRWWSDEKVIIVPREFELGRRDVVLAMANQDGGAHVDPEIDEAYYRLTRENAVGYTVATALGSVPIEEIASATVRQIGQEVLVSLVNRTLEIPVDLPDPDTPPRERRWLDVNGNERLQRAIFGCPCKNGKAYRECHGVPIDAAGRPG